MKVTSIKFHIDSGISNFCKKPGGIEVEKITLEHVRHTK